MTNKELHGLRTHVADGSESAVGDHQGLCWGTIELGLVDASDGSHDEDREGEEE